MCFGFSRSLWSLMLVSTCRDCLCYILQVSMALIHDAVQLFARALRRLDSASVDISPLDCEKQMSWGHGASLINFMKDVSKIVPSSELQCITRFAFWHLRDSWSYEIHLCQWLPSLPLSLLGTCCHILMVVLPDIKSCDGRKNADRYCV
jgi:hypothetical protein